MTVSYLFCGTCPSLLRALSWILLDWLWVKLARKLNSPKSSERLDNTYSLVHWVLHHAVSFCSPSNKKRAALSNIVMNLVSSPRNGHFLLIAMWGMKSSPQVPQNFCKRRLHSHPATSGNLQRLLKCPLNGSYAHCHLQILFDSIVFTS